MYGFYRYGAPHGGLWPPVLHYEAQEGGAVNFKKGCFGRNTKFFWESEDFASNQETREIFWETKRNKVKISGILRYFVYLSQKFWTIFHIVLLKQHLL